MKGRPAYQPQQSVLKRHFGQRQTACIRYIAFPQRSQAIGAPSEPSRHSRAAAGS